MREVGAHSQNDNRSVAAEIFVISTYFPNTPRNYLKELQSRLQSGYEAAKNSLITKKECSKEHHDKTMNVPLFSVGDKVLFHDERIRRDRSLKLSQPWIGPYEILDVDNVNITLRLPRNKTLKVHANRLKPFFG
jgi:hypothetical protein